VLVPEMFVPIAEGGGQELLQPHGAVARPRLQQA
jgi:hypothetical protein